MLCHVWSLQLIRASTGHRTFVHFIWKRSQQSPQTQPAAWDGSSPSPADPRLSRAALTAGSHRQKLADTANCCHPKLCCETRALGHKQHRRQPQISSSHCLFLVLRKCFPQILCPRGFLGILPWLSCPCPGAPRR